MPPYSRSAVRAHSELDPLTLGEDTFERLRILGAKVRSPTVFAPKSERSAGFPVTG